MAITVAGLCLLSLDVLLRRLIFPIVLLSAIVFRYNLLSLVYLLLFVVHLLLPGPRLKSHKWSSVIFLVVVLIFSGVASVGQALFQITLATSYKQKLNPCSGTETVWRQIGFEEFDIPAVHVVRLLLPDVIVFLGSVVTLCANLSAVRLCRSGDGSGVSGGASVGAESGDSETTDQDEAKSRTNEMGSVLSGKEPPYPSTVQCYYQLPKLVNHLLDLAVFVLLMLSGVAVPSVLSSIYYEFFLLVLIIWSLGLKLKWLIRVIRVALTMYATVHLVLLDLYQFQSGQEIVVAYPMNTTDSLLSRLFGLTPVIQTDCTVPYELILHPNVNYTRFISPALILLLLVVLSTDLRLWLFTPKLLWTTYSAYCLPVHDQVATSNRLHCISKQGLFRRQAFSTNYGSTGSDHLNGNGEDTTRLEATPSPEGPTRKPRRIRITWELLYNRAAQSVAMLWSLLLKISFILSIISMMAWSVLFPSWPSLVLLLWTCAIWLIPKINPRDSLFYTSPLLVLYALVLVHVQYVYSLDLTRSELPRSISLGFECPHEGDMGCRSGVLLAKTLFTIVFFMSFHEFVLLMKEKIKERRQRYTPDHTLDTDGEVPLVDLHEQEGRESPSEEDVEVAAARANVYKSLYRLVSTYWILAVLGAFLLVSLTGPPSLLKSIYLVFLFLFMVTYQVTEKFWYYLSFIVWWLLIFYAVIELVLVYTYQFDVVKNGWGNLYNSSYFAQNSNISATVFFDTIGLTDSSHEFRFLAVSLIPPAVFIAVLALQLRYFTPKSPFATQIEERAATAIDLVSLFPQFMRTAIQKLKDDAEEEEEEANSEESSEGVAAEGDLILLPSLKDKTGDQEPASPKILRQTTISSEVSSSIHPSRLQSCYRFTVYIFHKTRQVLVDLLDLTWRFLELHLHKVVGLTLFATCLYEISALYWILLAFLLLLFPLPVLNFLTYPLITVFLGALSTSKMIYQTPLILSDYFAFDNQCNPPANFSGRGLVYENITTDAGWIGFNKNTSRSLALPIVASLFMTLWFSARRYQVNHRRSQGIKVQPYERGSLFLGVTKKKADRSILSAAKYLINHFFEMYGVEVCWAMLAITVAVRIDIYGVIYGLVLGLLLLVPRAVLGPVWLLYLFIHGLLLLAQYFFLLGAPPGVCFTGSKETVYPWSRLPGVAHPDALKRWLFLTGDRVQILDKTLLYADFIVYLLVALQFRYFARNPLKQGTPDQTNGLLVNMYKLQYSVDYLKVLVFQYSFWVSLFVMFLTAATRVSLFGLLYLLLGLIFLYRGQDMLRDKQRNRHRSWASLRLVTWLILLLGVCLQILDCVSLDNHCVVLLLFNGLCNKEQYYGSDPPTDCPHNTLTVGLWIDALNFIVLTLQIILFDTDYSEQVKTELTQKELNAKFFRDVFDTKIEEQRKLNREEREIELQKLRERATHLTETRNKIEHILYAGLRVPENIGLRTTKAQGSTTEETSESRFGLSDGVSLISDDPQQKASPSPSEAGDPDLERSGLAQTWVLVKSFLFRLVDSFIEYMESSSVIFRAVVTEMKTSQSAGDVESQPFAQPASTYGSTEVSPDPDGTQKVDVPVEVYTVDEDASKDVGVRPGAERSGDPPEEGGATPVVFDIHGGALVDELHLKPSARQREEIESYEEELEEDVRRYSTRLRRLVTAIYYMCLSHSEYLVYFLLVLNILLNGSILSLVYAFLLFSWGLLSIPVPTKRFWITLILYTMLVLFIKYAFQFYDLDQIYWTEKLGFNPNDGLYPPRILGILHRENFITNAVWDILLLIALLFHRSLLRQYGLWRSSLRKDVSSIFLALWKSMKNFFRRLFNPEISQGAHDYYAIMLIFDVLCFLTIVFGVSSFGVENQYNSGSQVAVAEFIRTNYVPLSFVIMLLLQFLSMLVDRAIYLRHSVKAKLAFQILLLLAWHIWLFFLLPSNAVNGRPFTENAAAQCIYFFKFCYFIVSSLQIISGYPIRVLGFLLTKSYDIFTWLAFLGYRLIPLLPELREVTDWGFTDTTLSLFNWFKVQEIYAQLFLIKVQRERELEYPRYLGEKQTWVAKVFLGGLLIAGLVLLIWGPLLVMSFISTSSQPNIPVEVSIRVTLSGYEPVVGMIAPRQTVVPLDATEYDDLKRAFRNTPAFPLFDTVYFMNDFTRVTFPGVSSTTWAISPPSRNQLIEELEKTKNSSEAFVPLEFYWSITRAPSSGLAAEVVSGLTSRNLTNSTDSETIDQLLDALSRRTGSVKLEHLYPAIVQAPANGASTNFTELTSYLEAAHSSRVSCDLTLENGTLLPNTTTFVEWWSLQCEHNLTNMFESSSLDMFIYSNRVAPPLFSAITSIGIIGLYVSVVLVIGRFIRTYISDLPTRLYIDEILDPDPLLKLCNDIFLVRECKEFQLEEILVGKLFYIFKSPDKVAKVTDMRPKIKRE